MTLEQQVVSLELAKKLKELGVKQESLFWWSVPINQTVPEPDFSALEMCKPEVFYGKINWGKYFEPISAFTVAELGENLQPYLQRDIWLRDQIAEAMDDASYMRNEADARATMLIYLLENNLITL